MAAYLRMDACDFRINLVEDKKESLNRIIFLRVMMFMQKHIENFLFKGRFVALSSAHLLTITELLPTSLSVYERW